MDDQTLLYGSRSGIQKAVRRGDLDLAKTCFDILWPDKTQRSWLKWRLPAIVGEDCWFMAGELAKLQNSESQEEKDWRRFVYQLTLVVKNKDASAFEGTHLLRLSGEEKNHPEFRQFKELRKLAGNAPDSIIMNAKDTLAESAGVNSYTLGAMQALANRALQGGMLGDKWVMLSSQVMLASRGLDEEEVQEQIQQGFIRWLDKAGSRQPRTVDLPWFVFDMHTVAGKMAMSAVFNKQGDKFRLKSKEELDLIWFLLESAFVPPELRRQVPYALRPLPSCFEEMWWQINVRSELNSLENWNYRAAKEDLWPQLQPELERLVQWALTKSPSLPNRSRYAKKVCPASSDSAVPGSHPDV